MEKIDLSERQEKLPIGVDCIDEVMGGDISLGAFSELEKEYSEGNIHPMDLKEAATISLDKLIAPARKVLSAESG